MAVPRHRSSASPLALAWAALVVYASLFPFSGWRWPPGQTLQALLVLPWPPWIVPFDLWANFAGYVPLGALLLIAAQRSGVAPALALLLAVLLPAGLSYATEVTQQFLPGRHPSLKDCAMNTLGAGVGALLGAALHRLRLIDRWHGLRERWFVPNSAGALALLALWPLGLLFPAPAPLGLGQVGEELRTLLLLGLEDVPWAEGVYQLLDSARPVAERLGPLAEGMVTALGLLGPCLVAYTVVAPGWRRAVLTAGALAMATLSMTLSTLLNFGPQHALAWMTPVTLPALLAACVAAVVLVPLGRRAVAGLALVALAVLVTLVAKAPANPYFALSLQAWEQGQFVRFHGLAQWIGWLWPFAAIGWLLSRLGAQD